MKHKRDNTKQTMLWIMALILGAMFILPNFGHAAFFDNWIAPGQTTNGRHQSIVYVSTDPTKPSTITLVNSELSDLWIQNVSTGSQYRIYLTTTVNHIMYGTAPLAGVELAGLRFSSNAYPTPNANVIVLGEYSTTTFKLNSQLVELSTPAIANLQFNLYSQPGVSGLHGWNTYHEKEAGWMTYLGPWFAVAVGTFGPAAQTGSPVSAGFPKARVVKEQP